MGKRIAVVQSSYIPWKGYFDLIRSVDEFVLYDDTQFTRRDWRSRNRIKAPQGLQWLTVPVAVKGKYHQEIRDVEVADPDWSGRHWQSIRHAYGRAPHFRDYADRMEALYSEVSRQPSLSRINRFLTEALCGLLGITTPIRWSWEYEQAPGRNERLISICRSSGADAYLSGPAAKAYIDVGLFEASGITVEFADYTGYPEYPQQHGDFEHAVSVIDLLFNCGSSSQRYFRRQ